MMRMLFLAVLLIILAPVISPASIIVPAGAPEGSTVSMEWGTYKDGVWESEGGCLAERKTEIEVAKGETVYFSCDVGESESASFRLYSIGEDGEKRFMQQIDKNLYTEGDGICSYGSGESCLYSKDCACPDGYFCYLDGPYGSYTAEDFEASGIDADLSKAGQGCLPDSLEAVYGSAGSEGQGSCIGECDCNECGKYWIDNENCDPWETCVDDGLGGAHCEYREDCADEALKEGNIEIPDDFEWKCDGGPNKDLGCNPIETEKRISNAIEVCEPDPLMRAAVYYWILSNPLIKEQAENGLYDDAMIKIFEKTKDITKKYNHLPYADGCSDITPDSMIIGHLDENSVCTHRTALMLSMGRTLGIPEERIFRIGFGTATGNHVVLAYESDDGEWRFFDAGCCWGWATQDNWHSVCTGCDCQMFIGDYQNDYGFHGWEDGAMFGSVCANLPTAEEYYD